MKMLFICKKKEKIKRLMETLKRYGYSVYYADNGKEGIDISINEMVDLIISDIELDNYSGIDIVKIIKKILPDTEIIVCGYYERNICSALNSLGISHFLEYPFDDVELITAIECTNSYKKEIGEFFYSF